MEIENEGFIYRKLKWDISEQKYVLFKDFPGTNEFQRQGKKYEPRGLYCRIKGLIKDFEDGKIYGAKILLKELNRTLVFDTAKEQDLHQLTYKLRIIPQGLEKGVKTV